MRDQLIIDHVPHVRRLAQSMAARASLPLDADEFESEGFLALTEAAAKYDQARGIPFWGYAWQRIRGAMLDLMRRGQSRRRLHEEFRRRRDT